MKRFVLSILASVLCSHVYAVGLVDVYKDAQLNDQTYKQAEGTFLANKEAMPQAVAVLLPQLSISGSAGENWSNISTTGLPSTNVQGPYYIYQLTATQTLFNWAQFAGLKFARASVNQAAATVLFAQQDLILRTAQAYFNVLQAEETLRYAGAQRKALESQYNVSSQRYKVGLDPITAVYQSKAAYDSANAAYLANQTNLNNQKEALRVITNKSYSTLNRLRYDFPLVAPSPTDIETWTQAAVQKNLNLKASRYGMLAAQDNISVQYGANLPTVALQGTYGTNANILPFANGGNNIVTSGTLGVQANYNIFTGGTVTSVVREARAQYQTAAATMELTYRNTVASTRQDYLGVMVGLSQIEADRQAIKSNLSALSSIEAGYKVGTQTLTDVLVQQQNLYQAQTQYATDRFNFLLTTIRLKLDIGSLSVEDLAAIDKWLSENYQSTLTETPIASVPTPASTPTTTPNSTTQ